MNKNFKNISAIALATSIVTTSAIAGITASEASAQGAGSVIEDIIKPNPDSQAAKYQVDYAEANVYRGQTYIAVPQGVYPIGTKFKETGPGSSWTNVNTNTGIVTLTPNALIPLIGDRKVEVEVTYPDGSKEISVININISNNKDDSIHTNYISLPGDIYGDKVEAKTFETSKKTVNPTLGGVLGGINIDSSEFKFTNFSIDKEYAYGFVSVNKDTGELTFKASGDKQIGRYPVKVNFEINGIPSTTYVAVDLSPGKAPAPTTKTVTSTTQAPAPKPTTTKAEPKPTTTQAKPTTTQAKPTTTKANPTTTTAKPTTTTTQAKPTTTKAKPTTTEKVTTTTEKPPVGVKPTNTANPTVTETETVVKVTEEVNYTIENKFDYQPIDVEQGRTVAFLPKGQFATGTKFSKTKKSPEWFSVDEKTGRVTIDQSKAELALGDYKAGVVATYPDGKTETKEVIIKSVLKTDGMGKNTYKQNVKDVTVKAGQSVIVDANLGNNNIPERVRQSDVMKNFIPVLGDLNDIAAKFGFERTNIPASIVKGISLDGKILVSPDKNVAPGEYTISVPITKYGDILNLVSNLPIESLTALESPQDLLNNPELTKELMKPEAVASLIKLIQGKDDEVYYADFVVTVLPYDANDKEFNNDTVVIPKTEDKNADNDSTDKSDDNKQGDKEVENNVDVKDTESDNIVGTREARPDRNTNDVVVKNNTDSSTKSTPATTTQDRPEENIATTGVNSSQLALSILALLSVAGVAAYGMRRENA